MTSVNHLTLVITAASRSECELLKYPLELYVRQVLNWEATSVLVSPSEGQPTIGVDTSITVIFSNRDKFPYLDIAIAETFDAIAKLARFAKANANGQHADTIPTSIFRADPTASKFPHYEEPE